VQGAAAWETTGGVVAQAESKRIERIKNNFFIFLELSARLRSP